MELKQKPCGGIKAAKSPFPAVSCYKPARNNYHSISWATSLSKVPSYRKFLRKSESECQFGFRSGLIWVQAVCKGYQHWYICYKPARDNDQGTLKGTFIYKIRPLAKSAYQKNNFLISQPKHMLWVLKRTVSMRRFF